ncbi:MAG: hypothetical protein V5B30_16150 [Candidatus Accumulibacter delftensis]
MLVCGAAINTLLLAEAGKLPSIFQPVIFRKLTEKARSRVLTIGVVKIVRCMGLPVGYGAKQLAGGQTSALKTPAALSPVGAAACVQ